MPQEERPLTDRMKPVLVAAGLLAVGGGAAVALKPSQSSDAASVSSALHPLLPVGSAAPAMAAAAPRIVVTTRNYDLGRTGWNRNEPRLKPANVTASTFHKVGVLRVDDKIESSPLYVASVHTSAGTRDVLLVTTTNNSVYAFDANSQAQLWKSVDSLRPEIPKLKDANQCSVPNSERRCEGGNAQVCKTVGGVRVWQTVQDCVAAKKLCQITSGACCTPSNGFNGSNRNCL